MDQSNKYSYWVAMFSQTGTEISLISEQIGKYPDLVICNRQDDFEGIDDRLIGNARIVFTNSKPTTDEYLKMLPVESLVTMHGWLRIVPGKVCDDRTIYNGHPGLITKYPELKGKDPQAKAVSLGLESTGCIIHEATAEVDSGEIVSEKEVSIAGMQLPQVYDTLHSTSVKLWVNFLKEKLNECSKRDREPVS